jgi:PAS domain S-box-containing protein
MKLRYTWALQSVHGIVLLSAAVALALTALVVNDLRREYVHEIQSSKDKTATLAKLLEEHTRQSLRRVDFSLQAIHRDAEGKALRSRLLEDGLVESFSILASDGRALATTLAEGAASKPGPVLPDYIAAHQSPSMQPLFVGAAVKAPGTGRWLIPVSIRIDGPDNTLQGVVLAMLHADYFQSYYDSMDTGTNGFVTLFTRDAWIAARSPTIEKLFTQNWRATPMFKEHLPLDSFKTVRQVVVADGIERLYSYRALPDYPVVVSAGVSLTDALAPWRKRMWSESIALCIVLVGLTLATVQLVRQLRRNAHTEKELQFTALSVGKASLPIFWIAPDARILRVNQAACDLHGYTEAQLLSMAITDLDPDFPTERWPSHWAELRQKKRMCFETTQRNCAGNITPVEVDLNFVEFEGQEYNFAYIRDITSRKATEEQLVGAVNTARAASLSKSQFLANMSHEIRTPMNAILGMLTLLRKTELTARQADYAAKSDGAARALLGLLNEILDFSKIEAGKMTLDPHPFSMDQLLRNLSLLLASNVGDKPVEVLFDISPLVPHQLVGDAMRLQQVLLNLGSNAIKFTERGEVVLAVDVLQRDADCVTLQFSVRDSGIGIATENQARIFTGFTQAESSTTRRFGGTGLGVAISQRFVSLMGGQLELQSQLGHGSRFFFTVTLAVVADSDEEEHQRVQANAERGALRVMVIDDHPTAREVLANLAQSLGWQVDRAEGGAQALKMFQQRALDGIQYQAIFVDWTMPEMDGWDTSQHIREMQAQSVDAQDVGQSPVIVMVTAHDREMLSQRSPAEQSLMDGFLVKPVTASMLLDAVIDARNERGYTQNLPVVAPEMQQRLEGLRLLVVEDNKNNQQVARELLEGEGALVQIANHGQEAVEAIAAAQSAFDVVLMDLQMPVMDGFAATKIIRNDLSLTQLRIVAMTANAMTSDREACLAAGMNDHVGKPFDINDLVHVLRRQMQWGDLQLAPVNVELSLSTEIVQAASHAKVDLHAALHRLGEKQDVYRRMLSTFVSELQAMPDQLQILLRGAELAQTHSEAKRLLHTLKGLAATLGAMELSRAAAHAEKAMGLSTSDDHTSDDLVSTSINQACHAIANALPSLQALLEALHKDALSANAGADAPSLDVPALVRALQEMGQLLEAEDMESMNAMATLQQQFGEALAENLSALEAAMSDLDFVSALPHCNALLQKYRV